MSSSKDDYKKQVILTPEAPQPIGPYSQAVACSGFIFVSGQLGINTETKILEEGVVAQTHRALINISKILEHCGLAMDHIVKTTIFLKNMQDFRDVNEIYTGFFGSTPPARSTVQVAALPLDALVEIEAIACKA